MTTRDKLPLIAVSVFYICIFAAVLSFGWIDGWSLFFVDTMTPPLADLRTVQGALVSLQDGVDPYVENPGDPWNRTLNYPAIWILIGKVFALDVETNFVTFVLTFEAIFLCCLGYILYRSPSWTLAFVAISGAILMGIERGNNDLLIFSIIFLALLAPGLSTRTTLIAIASILKLYPIFAGVSLLTRQNVGQSFLWRMRHAIALAAIFLIYLGLFFGDLIQGVQNTYSAGAMSYGVGVVAFLANERFPTLPVNMTVVSGFLAGAIALMALFRERLSQLVGLTKNNNVAVGDLTERMFLAGGTIYVMTFFAGSNWDYRMVFCILTVPFMLSVSASWFRTLYQATILIALNQFTLVAALGVIGGAINMAGKVFLMLILAFVLTNRLPGLLLPGTEKLRSSNAV